jgi:hypothetical protein
VTITRKAKEDREEVQAVVMMVILIKFVIILKRMAGKARISLKF